MWTTPQESPTMATVLAMVSTLTKFELCGSVIPWLEFLCVWFLLFNIILIRAGLVYSFLLLCNFLIVWLYHCLSGLPLMDVWETSSLIVMNNGILNHVVHSLNSCGDRPDSDTIMVMETHMLLWMLANSWTIYMNWEDMNWDFWCLHTQWYPQSVFR